MVRCKHVSVCGLTRLLLLHTDAVPVDESFGTVAAERAFSVATDLIQTVTGQHPVTALIYV